jgi:hypothetical protein
MKIGFYALPQIYPQPPHPELAEEARVCEASHLQGSARTSSFDKLRMRSRETLRHLGSYMFLQNFQDKKKVGKVMKRNFRLAEQNLCLVLRQYFRE